MNKVIKMFFYTLFVFLTSCTNPPHIQEAHRIMREFNNEMKQDGYELFVSGGALADDIKEIHLTYATQSALTMEQMRFIVVDSTEKLLTKINNDSRIQSYLHNSPFTPYNIHLGINSFTNGGDYISPPFIAHGFLSSEKNTIFYSIYDTDKNMLKRVYKEPYEEALRIYNETMSICE